MVVASSCVAGPGFRRRSSCATSASCQAHAPATNARCRSPRSPAPSTASVGPRSSPITTSTIVGRRNALCSASTSVLRIAAPKSAICPMPLPRSCSRPANRRCSPGGITPRTAWVGKTAATPSPTPATANNAASASHPATDAARFEATHHASAAQARSEPLQAAIASVPATPPAPPALAYSEIMWWAGSNLPTTACSSSRIATKAITQPLASWTRRCAVGIQFQS